MSPSPMPHSSGISIGGRDHTEIAEATLKQMGGLHVGGVTLKDMVLGAEGGMMEHCGGTLIRVRHWVAACPDMHPRNDIETMATLDLSDKRESWCRGQYCQTVIPVIGSEIRENVLCV